MSDAACILIGLILLAILSAVLNAASRRNPKDR
jgi:hypothetical protein